MNESQRRGQKTQGLPDRRHTWYNKELQFFPSENELNHAIADHSFCRPLPVILEF